MNIALLVMMIWVYFVGNWFDTKTHKIGIINLHGRFVIKSQWKEFFFLIIFKQKVDPIIGKTMLGNTAIILRAVFSEHEKGIFRNYNILFINCKNGICFYKKQEMISASIRTVDNKICIMAMIVADIVYNHTAPPYGEGQLPEIRIKSLKSIISAVHIRSLAKMLVLHTISAWETLNRLFSMIFAQWLI